MSNCTLNFAFANQERSYAVIEAACGTLVKPAATNRMYTVGPVDFQQDQEFRDDGQLRETASRLASIKGKKLVGELSFGTYVKPSGTAGTAPEHDELFQCLMGTKDITPDTSVAYTLANQLDSFSLWVRKGHTVFAFRGVTVESAEFGIAGNEIAGINWGCKYMEQGYAGTCVAAGGAYVIGNTVITLPAGGVLLYTEGMYVELGDDDNGGDGYKIDSINFNLNTITLSTGLLTAVGSAPTVAPWYPAAGTEVGAPVDGKLGMVTVGGADAIVLSAKVTVKNNIKYYEDEKNNTWTAERFGRPTVREIEGDLTLFYMERGTSYWYRAEYQTSDALIIPAGNVAGSIMTLNVPYAEYRTPKLSGDEEFNQEIPFRAVASAALNDEFSIVFT